MNQIHACIMSLVFLHTAAMARSEFPAFPIHSELENAFAHELGSLYEKELTTKLETLQEELRSEARLKVALLTTPGPEANPAALYKSAAPSVVAIGSIYNCGRCDDWHVNAATGFVVADGIVMTNYHVMEAGPKSEAFGIRTFDGRVFPVRAVLASDKLNDVALVAVDTPGIRPLSFCESIEVGEAVVVIAHPVGNMYTVTDGIVSNTMTKKRRNGEKFREFTITADFAKGSSGGPILNRYGQVIGMVRATVSTYYNRKEGVDTNLQMVWKYVIPATEMMALSRPATVSTTTSTESTLEPALHE